MKYTVDKCIHRGLADPMDVTSFSMCTFVLVSLLWQTCMVYLVYASIYGSGNNTHGPVSITHPLTPPCFTRIVEWR
jgi:hypothetical protein